MMARQIARPLIYTGFNARSSGLFVAVLIAVAWAMAALPLSLVAAGAALISVAFALLRWPWIIWPALALALPVASGVRLGPLTASELVLSLCVFLWLIDGARRRRLRIYTSPVLIPVLVYAAVQLVSLLQAPGLGDGIAEVVKWLEFALVIGLLPVMLPQRHVVWMAAALVAAGVAQSVLGLYQFTFQVGPEWFVLYDRFMRASGSFRQPNPYAGYLGVVLPVAASMAIWAWTPAMRSSNRVVGFTWALFFTSSSLVIVMGLLASWSRGGWISATAALIVVVAVRSRKGMALAVAGAMAVATAALYGLLSPSALPPTITARLQGAVDLMHPGDLLSQPVTDDNFALLERMAHWVAGIRMWESAPWLGIGAGNFARLYDSVNVPIWTEPLGHAHNLYLNILAETGLIGLAAFGVMWIGIAVWAWRRRDRSGHPDCSSWCRAMTAAVLGAMTFLTLHSMVDVLFVQGIYLALALTVATLAAGCSSQSEDQPVEHSVRA